uniref:Ig-like domain-containing protein n=1 Tax=Xiphophorus couchianus TaxID=32473 RepID=A0A3B5MEG3_9TELE
CNTLITNNWLNFKLGFCISVKIAQTPPKVDGLCLIMSIDNMSLYFYVTGEDASCPIELIPPRVVVKYGDPISVNCTTSAEELDGLGWEASEGGASAPDTQRYVMLTVQSVTQWRSHPMCFLNFKQSQCTFPENISISSSIESSEEMTENEEYSFTCSILNIAPVQNLTVRWYKGNQVIYSENLTNSTKHPTNQTSIFRFTPTRQDDRTTIRCEAHMDLGPEGPQFNASSRELSIGVMCKGPMHVTKRINSQIISFNVAIYSYFFWCFTNISVFIGLFLVCVVDQLKFCIAIQSPQRICENYSF